MKTSLLDSSKKIDLRPASERAESPAVSVSAKKVSLKGERRPSPASPNLIREDGKLSRNLKAQAGAALKQNNEKVLKEPSEPRISQKSGLKMDIFRIKKIIKKELSEVSLIELSDIGDNEPFSELGLDSVLGVELTNRLKKILKVSLPATKLYNHPSVNALAAYLSTSAESGGESIRQTDWVQAGQGDALKETAASGLEEDFQESPQEEQPQRTERKAGRPEISSFKPARPKARVQNNRGVAIIGVSARFPEAPNIKKFWKNLASGRDSVKEAPLERLDHIRFYDPDPKAKGKTHCKWGGFLEEHDMFDPLFFNISPAEAELTDPQQRIFLQEAWRALEDAGYSGSALSGVKCGVYVGVMVNDYERLLSGKSLSLNPSFEMLGNFNSILAARIAYFLNLRGAALAVDTACSSSLTATHLACQSLLRGEADMALTGGVTLYLSSDSYVMMSKAGMLSAEGKCKTFDDSADGFVPGEGAGALVLKRLDKAREDGDHIYGVILGGALNQDGKTNGITAPNADAQRDLQLEVYRETGVNPETITYVEAHGTGTKLGDPIEIEALTGSFGKHTRKTGYCAIGSVKTNIGHTSAAAGAAGIIKILLSMKHKQIPPSLNYNTCNSHIDFSGTPFYVNTELKDWDCGGLPRRAAVSSFGFSGTNAHLLLEEYVDDAPRPEFAGPYFVVLSAGNEDRLRARARDLADFLREEPQEDFSMAELSCVLSTGRMAMEERLALIVEDGDDLARKLESWLENGEETGVWRGNVEEGSAAEDLVSGVSGKRFIEAVIEEKDLGKLARLWTRGVEIDWNLLYGERKPRKISLPTYPFEKRRCWVAKVEGGVAPAARVGLRPLLDEIAADLSMGEGMVFRKTIVPGDRLVSEHRVKDKALFPGAGFVEAAFAALDQVEDPAGFDLCKIRFLKPFWADEERDLLVFLERAGSKIRYRIQSSAEEGEELHSKGEFRPKKDSAKERLEVDKLKASLEKTTDKDQFYSDMKNLGLDYGPAFRVVREIRFNQKLALGLLETEKKHPGYFFGPEALDGILQAASVLNRDTGLSLPLGIEKLESFSALKDRIWVRAQEVGPNKFDLAVFSLEGELLLRISGFSVRKPQDALNSLFYIPRWSEAMTIPSERASVSGPILIVGGRSARELSRAIAVFHAGERVFEIEEEDGWPDDLDQIGLVYFLGGIWPRVLSLNQWNKAVEASKQALSGLFRLIKSLDRDGFIVKGLGVKIVANNIFKIGDEPSIPYSSGLWGFARSLAREYKKLRFSCLDICLSGTGSETPDDWKRLAREVVEEPFVDEIIETVVRDGARLRRRLSPAVFSPVRESVFKDGGVYLIVGGAGGLGLELARYLAQTRQAGLILIGRSPLDAEKESRLKEFRALGSKAVYLRADASDFDSLKEAVKRGRELTGPINGAIHSALALEDRLFSLMSEDEFEKPLAAKIDGSVALTRIMADEKPDFLLFFSSMQSFWGNVGQSNYAAASSFQDAWALSADLELDFPVKVINWGFWGAVGAVADPTHRKLMAEQGIYSINTEEGMEALERILGSSVSQAGAVKADRETLENLDFDFGSKLIVYPSGDSNGVILEAASPDEYPALPEPRAKARPPARKKKRKTLPKTFKMASANFDLAAESLSYLKSIFSEVLKVDESGIKPDKTFENYGVDSLMIMELTNRLEEDFGFLNATLLFENTTLKNLNDYFVANHRSRLEKLLKLSASAETAELFEEAEYDENDLEDEEEEEESGSELTESLIKTRIKAGPASIGDDGIAVIGLSGRYPQAGNLESFWENLKSGKDCVEEVPAERWKWRDHYLPEPDNPGFSYSKWGGFLEDADKFDSLFFSVTPREAKRMDPQERLFLETVWNCLEDAGHARRSLVGSATGVFLGLMNCDYDWISAEAWERDKNAPGGPGAWSAANRVSYFFDWRGPSLAVDTACSSSLSAIHLACQSLKRGECELAVAGGVNLILHPIHLVRLSQMNMLSAGAQNRSFGAGADGFVDGEGVGAALLKPLRRALEDGDRVYGVIKGSWANSGGKTGGYTVPNPTAQGELITRAMSEAGVGPESLSYVETHGTGTSLGDPIEITGLKRAFGEKSGKRACALGSVKSNIGHLESAAGIAGLTKVLLQMKNRLLVPSLHCEPINPLIDFEDSPFYLQRESGEWRPREFSKDGERGFYPLRAGLSSFGAGGANVHLVIEESPEKEAPRAEFYGPCLIPLSAADQDRLRARVQTLVDFIEKNSGKEEPAFDLGSFIEREIFKSLSSLMGVPEEELELETPLSDQGVDMLKLSEWRELTEEKQGVVINPSALADRPSVASLRDYLFKNFSGEFSSWAEALKGEKKNSGISLSDLSHTLQTGREPLEERLALVVKDQAELLEKLKEYLKSGRAAGLFSGNAAKDDSNVELLTEGESGELFIKTAVKNKELSKLARLWVGGIEIDWSALRGNFKPRVISLPGYPFCRTRHWVLSKPEDGLARTVGEALEEAAPRQEPPRREVLKKSGAPPKIGLRAVSDVDSPSLGKASDHVQKTLLRDVERKSFEKQASLETPLGEKSWELDISEIREMIKKDMSEVSLINLSDIDEDKPFMELGLDSVLGVELTNRLKKTLNVQLSATKLYDYSTVNALAGYLASLKVESFDPAPGPLPAGDPSVRAARSWKPSQVRRQSAFMKDGEESDIFDFRPDDSRKARTSPRSVLPNSPAGVAEAGKAGRDISEVRKIVKKELSEVSLINLSDIDEDKPFMELGLDSVLGVELTNRLKKVFNVQLSATKLYDYSTVNALAEYLASLKVESFDPALEKPPMSSKSPKRKSARLGEPFKPRRQSGWLKEGGESDNFESRPLNFKKLKAALRPASIRPSEKVAERAALRPDIKETIKKELSEVSLINFSDIDDDKAFMDLGLDSVLGVELTNRLKKVFNVKLSATKLYDYSTVNALAEYLSGAVETGEAKQPPLNAAKLEAGPDPTPAGAKKRGDFKKVAFSLKPSSFRKTAISNPPASQKTILKPSSFRKTAIFEPGSPQKTVLKPSAEPVRQRSPKPASSPGKTAPLSVADNRGVAVVGMSARFPDARDLGEFWNNLASGKDSVREAPLDRLDWPRYYDPNPRAKDKTYCKWGAFLEDADKFDPLFFSVSPAEAELTDPQQRLFLQEAWRALEDAGYSPADLNALKCDVYAGVMTNDYVLMLNKAGSLLNSSSEMLGNLNSILAARISYFLNLKGTALAVDTACSSSLTATHLACQSLLRGEADMALAGGVTLYLSEGSFIMMSKAGMLSASGKCHTFDDAADGFVPGEGAAVLVLKTLSKAVEDGDHIYGVIKGCGTNQDGRTNGITAPSVESQKSLELRVYRESGINPETISLVEAHGTGTKLGDPIEVEALSGSFGEHTQKKGYCAIGSVKSNIGHTSAAAGAAGLIKLLLAMKHKKIPPSLNYNKCNSHMDFSETPFYVNVELKDWESAGPRRAAVSSFGFSGTNAHLVVEEFADSRAPRVESEPPYLIVLSARNQDRLQAYARKLIRFLENESGELCLSSLAGTLQMGRKPMDERLALSADGRDELLKGLKDYLGQAGERPGLRFGNVKRPRETSAGGRAGRDFINALISRRETEQLAALWVGGAEIDWRLFYNGSRPRKMSLPAYPFEKRRCWMPESGEGSAEESGASLRTAFYPLLDEDVSAPEERAFVKELRGDQAWLRDHLVKGEKLLPGAAQLEMARAAAELAFPGKRVARLKNLIWAAPVKAGSEPQKVKLSLSSQKEGELWRLTDLKSGALRSQGEVEYLAPGESLEAPALDLEEIKRRRLKKVEREEHYRAFAKVGLSFGPAFRTVESLLTGEGEALARLKAPDIPERDFPARVGLLDGSLQTTMSLTPAEEGAFYLPFSLGEAEFFKPLPKELYVYAALSGPARPGVRSFDLSLCDLNGEICVKISRFTLKSFKGAEKESGSSAQSLCFEPAWREEPAAPERDFAGDALIAGADPSFLEAWQDRFPQSRAVSVSFGSRFSKTRDGYIIRRERREDYSALAAGLKEEGTRLEAVLYFGSAGNDPEESPPDPGSLLEKSFYSPFYLCAALAESDFTLKFLYLRREGFERSYFDEAWAGLGKSVSLERPRLFCRSLALEDLSDARDVLSKVSRELASEERSFEVRYRGERRQTKFFKELSLEPRAGTLLKKGGVYLISGGLGGLGLLAARRLAAKYGAGLALVGRSEASADQLEKLAELEKAGGEAIYISADISSLDDVQRALAETRARFGKINGVLHCAGTLKDSLILKKTRAEAEAALGPKVYGAFYLDLALADEKLDFISFFSSAAGALGNPGQVDYAYGNAFLDALARRRSLLAERGRRFGVCVSVNWPYWSEGGMELDQATLRWMERTKGLAPLSAERGLDFFEESLSLGKPQLLFTRGDAAKLRKSLGFKSAADLKRSPGASLKSLEANQDWRAPLAGDLIRITSDILKVGREEIDPEENISEYGFDSISFTELTNRLNDEFSLDLDPPEMFERPTIESLASYLLESRGEELSNHYQTSRASGAEVAQESPGGGEDLSAPLAADLILITSDILKVGPDEIDPEENISEYGFDSISFTELTNRLNDKFSLDLDPPEMFERPTIESLASYLLESRRGELSRYYQSESRVEAPLSPVARVSVPDSVPEKSSASGPGIAVVGAAARLPEAGDLEDFWLNLQEGRDCVTNLPLERWDWRKYDDGDFPPVKRAGFLKDADKFDAEFFSISPLEAELMDPQHRLFLETVWKALEDAGYPPSSLAGSETGVFAGVSGGDYVGLLQREGAGAEAHTPSGNAHSILPNRVSYFFDWRGPSEAVDTACSSSLVAMHRAVLALRNGECEMAVAGGVNLALLPDFSNSFSKAGMLSPDGRCKTFDQSADGYVRGEGVGVVLLKPLDKALAGGDHIYGVIRGSAVNHGGRVSSLTAPNPNAQAAVVVKAHRDAGISPDSVGYVECHGTGTSLGDPIEINGLKRAFAELYQSGGLKPPSEPCCGLGSVKTNIGHLEAAAGIAGVLKTLLSMKHKRLPGILHFQKLNPYIKLADSPFYITDVAGEWRRVADGAGGFYPLRAGVSSFGFGGANAHVVLEEAPDSGLQAELSPPFAIVLSAADQERLRAAAQRLLDFLERRLEISLSSLACVLQTGRQAMAERLAFEAGDHGELLEKLGEYLKNGRGAGLYSGNSKAGERSAAKGSAPAASQKLSADESARLWAKGVEVDWSLLYQESRPPKISLPTYPFARERHWISEQEKPAPREPAHGSLVSRPLIDAGVSTFKKWSFEKELRPDQFYLDHHRVGGKRILPGAAHLEMAQSAGILAGAGPDDYKLRGATLLRPVYGDEPQKIRIILLPRGEKLAWRTLDASDDKTVYSEGELVPRDKSGSGPRPSLDVEAIRGRLSQSRGKEELYRMFAGAGLEYGPGFQTIENLSFNDREALARLSLPDFLRPDFNAFALHPSLVDGALQTASGLFGLKGGARVPFALSELELLEPLSAEVYAYAAFSPGSDSVFDVSLLSPEGRVLAVLSKPVLKSFSLGLKEASPPPPPSFSPSPGASLGQSFYFESVWEASPGFEEVSDLSGDVLIFDSEGGLFETFERRFGRGGSVLVSSGSEQREKGGRRCLRPESEGDWRRLLDGLSSEGRLPNRMIYISRPGSPKSLDPELIKSAIHPLFYFNKALVGQKLKERVRLLFVYQLDSDQLCFDESVSGLLKSAGLENPRLWWRSAGLENLSDSKDVLFKSLGELSGEDDAFEARHAGGGREVRLLREFAPEALESSPGLLRERGVYLITGGLGGLGLLTARRLAEKYRARLILAGRSKLSELSPEKRGELASLENLGAEAVYVSADVSKAADVRGLTAGARSRFGSLNGVIHGAGALADGLINDKSSSDLDAVLSSKIKGGLLLDQATKGERLDFMVFFSSASGVLGNVGQSDYACGNSFLDSLAERRARLVREGSRFGKTVSIAWPVWAEGGMKPSEEVLKWLEESRGIIPLPTVKGLDFLESALGLGKPRVMLSEGLADQTRAVPAEDSRVFSKAYFRSSPAESVEDRPWISGVEEIQAWISESVRTSLKIKSATLDIHKSLESYGMDSIMLTSMVRKLNKRWGLDVPAAELAERPDIASISEALAENYFHVGLSAGSGEPQGLAESADSGLGESASRDSLSGDVDLNSLSEAELDRLLGEKSGSGEETSAVFEKSSEEVDLNSLSEAELDRLLGEKSGSGAGDDFFEDDLSLSSLSESELDRLLRQKRMSEESRAADGVDSSISLFKTDADGLSLEKGASSPASEISFEKPGEESLESSRGERRPNSFSRDFFKSADEKVGAFDLSRLSDEQLDLLLDSKAAEKSVPGGLPSGEEFGLPAVSDVGSERPAEADAVFSGSSERASSVQSDSESVLFSDSDFDQETDADLFSEIDFDFEEDLFSDADLSAFLRREL